MYYKTFLCALFTLASLNSYGLTVREIHSEQEFDALIAQNAYVIADFYADYCPPCKAFAAALEELKNQYPQLVVLKISTQSSDTKALIKRFKVRSIPDIYFYLNGKLLNRYLGFQVGTLPNLIKSNFGL